MSYLSLLWSGQFKYLVYAFLIVLFFAVLKDRHKDVGTVFENQRWNLYDVLLFVLIFDSSFVVSFFLKKSYLTQLVIFWSYTTIMSYIAFRYKLKQSLTVLGLSKDGLLNHAFYGLKLILILQLLFYGFLSFSGLTEKILGMASVVSKGFLIYSNNYTVLVLLAISFPFIPPLLEEFIFRGILYSPFRRKVGKWGAISISGIIFGLYHGQLFNGQGALFAYMYEKKRSLVPSITAHSFSIIFHEIYVIYSHDLLNLGYDINSNSFAKIMFFICLSLLFFLVLSEYLSKLKARYLNKHSISGSG